MQNRDERAAAQASLIHSSLLLAIDTQKPTKDRLSNVEYSQDHHKSYHTIKCELFAKEVRRDERIAIGQKLQHEA
jgi:hypothetical protein